MSATEISSEAITIDRPLELVYEFLHDLRNYEALMPSDVSEFKADEDKAELKVSGLGAFTMHRGNCAKNERIVLNPKGKLPFQFNIEWNFSDSPNGGTIIKGMVVAQLNMFMKMMAESKLKNFVSIQADKMKTTLEEAIPNS